MPHNGTVSVPPDGTDVWYDDDTIIPFLMSFRAKRVHQLMSAHDLQKMFGREETA